MFTPTSTDAPLYSPSYEHDSCGVGLVVDIQGRPSRQIVEKALAGLVNLTHRGGVGADRRGPGLHEVFQCDEGLRPRGRGADAVVGGVFAGPGKEVRGAVRTSRKGSLPAVGCPMRD